MSDLKKAIEHIGKSEVDRYEGLTKDNEVVKMGPVESVRVVFEDEEKFKLTVDELNEFLAATQE